MRKLAKGLFTGRTLGRQIAASWNHGVKVANKGRTYRCTFGACEVQCSSPTDLDRHDFVQHEPIRAAARKAQAHAPTARPAEVG